MDATRLRTELAGHCGGGSRRRILEPLPVEQPGVDHPPPQQQRQRASGHGVPQPLDVLSAHGRRRQHHLFQLRPAQGFDAIRGRLFGVVRDAEWQARRQAAQQFQSLHGWRRRTDAHGRRRRHVLEVRDQRRQRLLGDRDPAEAARQADRAHDSRAGLRPACAVTRRHQARDDLHRGHGVAEHATRGGDAHRRKAGSSANGGQQLPVRIARLGSRWERSRLLQHRRRNGSFRALVDQGGAHRRAVAAVAGHHQPRLHRNLAAELVAAEQRAGDVPLTALRA